MAGKVGKISRHSNSQPRLNRTATVTTRAIVGRANHRLANAIDAKVTV